MHPLVATALVTIGCACAWAATEPLLQSSWEEGAAGSRADRVAARMTAFGGVLLTFVAGLML